MTTTTFSEFRNNAKKYFDLVEKKKVQIEIYRHSRPVAILSPITIKKPDRWKTANPLEIKGLNLSAAILKEREEA